MSNVKKVTTLLDLDLTDIPVNERAIAKREVGDFVVNEILRSTERGSSPVKGEGQFNKLNKSYADAEKGGRRTANLQLDGDLIDAIKSKNRRGTTIEVGVIGKEAPKCDGHNQHSEEAKQWARSKRNPKTKSKAFPKRRFIPDDGQKFTAKITSGINDILDNYRVVEDEVSIEPEIRNSSNTVSPEGIPTTEITIDNIFSDDVINGLLQDALNRG